MSRTRRSTELLSESLEKLAQSSGPHSIEHAGVRYELVRQSAEQREQREPDAPCSFTLTFLEGAESNSLIWPFDAVYERVASALLALPEHHLRLIPAAAPPIPNSLPHSPQQQPAQLRKTDIDGQRIFSASSHEEARPFDLFLPESATVYQEAHAVRHFLNRMNEGLTFAYRAGLVPLLDQSELARSAKAYTFQHIGESLQRSAHRQKIFSLKNQPR